MKATGPLHSQSLHSNNHIMDVMNLKLAQSDRSINSRPAISQKHTPLRNLIINTPSTHATSKKFHSCELHSSSNNHSASLCHQKRSSSSIKILTVPQIKTHQRRVSNSESLQKSLQKDKSKGIFVSISRKKLLSKQVEKECFLNQKDLKITEDQPKVGQKLQLNKYKEIARKANISRKLHFD